ncbi:BrnT family toxin [Terriglobus sp.]|uniref:BrnT family toxin n=1 Tax=Terriglobus sp. TaxID=1889013 RepID=UPI003B00A88F
MTVAASATTANRPTRIGHTICLHEGHVRPGQRRQQPPQARHLTGAGPDFDLDTSQFRVDERQDYGESRYVSVGFVGTELHTFVYTVRTGGIRAISLRRATRGEWEDYAEQH